MYPRSASALSSIVLILEPHKAVPLCAAIPLEGHLTAYRAEGAMIFGEGVTM
jgi:hypothetical protein